MSRWPGTPRLSSIVGSIVSEGSPRAVGKWQPRRDRAAPPRAAQVEEEGMSAKWIRVGIAAIVGIITLLVGLSSAGGLDTTANPDTGLVGGANAFMLVL